MGIKHCTPVFGMELYAHEPFVRRDFHNFNQVSFGIDTSGFHSRPFEPVQI